MPVTRVLIDWLSFTLPDGTPEALVDVLTGCRDWVQVPYGHYGYQNMKVCQNVKVMTIGRLPGMGIHVEMSGKGCRQVESVKGVLSELIIKVLGVGGKISRLDIAIDEMATGEEVEVGDYNLDLQRIRTYLQNGSVSTRYRECQFIEKHLLTGEESQPGGQTIYLGSSKSNTMIRFYDKALESGSDEYPHYVRCEIQCRKHRAQAMADEIASHGLERLNGVIRSYVEFKEPQHTDKQKDRWPIAEWWHAFLEGVEKVRLSKLEQIEKSVQEVNEWVKRQIGPLIAAIFTASGGDYDVIRYWADSGKARWKTRHQVLASQHFLVPS